MDLNKELTTRPNQEKISAIVNYVGSDPSRFSALINCMVNGEKKVSHYASWLVYPCMEKNPHLIWPHYKLLLNNLKKKDLHDTIKRSTMKAMANGGNIPEKLQGYVLQYCFDFLLDVKTAVSIQVYAMQTAFNISVGEPDLLRELKMVIEEGLPHGTAGYKSRGKRIINSINRILGQDHTVN
ncbi:MAG: hypothetical protein AAFZ15_08715 [Bacteroidota bacterium]